MERSGYHGRFGGMFIPEILVATFEELKAVFEEVKKDPSFWKVYQDLMSTYSCRPTPLTYSENLSRHFKGPHFYIKREDLNFDVFGEPEPSFQRAAFLYQAGGFESYRRP
jgi:tryptophan synthase beta chain